MVAARRALHRQSLLVDWRAAQQFEFGAGLTAPGRSSGAHTCTLLSSSLHCWARTVGPVARNMTTRIAARDLRDTILIRYYIVSSYVFYSLLEWWIPSIFIE